MPTAKVTADKTPEGDEYLPVDAFKAPLEFGLPTSRSLSRNATGKWPYESEAMAVCPKDIKRAQKILAEHGVKTEYDKLGRPIIRDKSHRKAHMAALGFYDRNAGYGDRAPEHFTMDYHPDNIEQKHKEFMANLAQGRMVF